MGDRFTSVATIHDIRPGQMLRVNVCGEWVVVANVDDNYFAIADTCSHEEASLSKGVLKGDCIRCPLHGSRFNVRTGEPMEEPAEEAVEVYPVKVVGDRICIGVAAAGKI